MRALLQRIEHASVHVGNECVGKAGFGLLILLGVTHADTEKDASLLADKCVKLRIFEDENGKMNRSLLDVEGEALIVSQFTLYADASHGRRPGYSDAAPPEQAEKLYEKFISAVKSHGISVATGRFGADMSVSLLNRGPVTIMLESGK